MQGAWISKQGNFEQVTLFIDGYFTHTVYDKINRKFIESRGGPYRIDDKKLTIVLEFDTKDTSMVNQEIVTSIIPQQNLLSIASKQIGGNYTRLDDGSSGLAGSWKITARKTENGKIEPIHQGGTRKTIKILSSTRFQWAAIDPATKAFLGTGGGTYTFKDGKYTEHIEFFSRDSSRVGASLSFNGRLENDGWHHSGLNSKGEPLYEVWNRSK